jgi:hypothetical protein
MLNSSALSRSARSAGRSASLVRRSTRLAVAVVLAAAGVAVGVLPYPSVTRSRADVVTASVNDLRDGWDSGEATGALSPATLLGGSFGELFDSQVDGQVYAQPIVADSVPSLGDTVIVATENDYVYSFNAVTGATNWQVSLGTPWPAAAESCSGLAPTVGVTGTPVYDPTIGTVYLVSEEVPPGNSDLHPAFYLDALNAATGLEQPGWPVQISGSPTNDPTVPFSPFNQLQRPGLLLNDGAIYAGFGSHCGYTPYKGYVVGVNIAAKTQTMWTTEAGTAKEQASIWQSGAGLMSDGDGRIFFATGNGVSPPPGPGDAPPGELSESVVRLAVQSNGSLVAKDFFSPVNAPYLDSIDGDLGSGGPVGLPFGTTALPDLLVQAGKHDGVFVLNRDDLGGREQGPNKTDAAVSEITTGVAGQWGHPAAFADTPVLTPADVATANDYVYYIGNSDVMRYLKAGLGGSNGITPVLTDVANSSDIFGYSSGSPVVTSDGTGPGADSSAVVWALNSSGTTGATGSLEAFPAIPGSGCTAAAQCTISSLWSFPLTNVGKFTIPATDNGRVYIATRGPVTTGSSVCGGVTVPAGTNCGQVYGFGSPSAAPVGGASPVNFDSIAVGGSPETTPVTITNTSSAAVTVNSVSAASSGGSNPFTATGPYVIDQATTPQACTLSPAPSTCVLQPGDTLTVSNVTFTPATAGSYTGSVQFGLASQPNFPVVSVSLAGIGTQPGFYSASLSLPFGQVPVNTTGSQEVIVTNGGANPITLSSTLPGAPYAVAGLPANGATVNPNQSLSLTVTYHPTATGAGGATLTLGGTDTVTTDALPPLQIPLTGTGVADVTPTLTGTASLSFGSVPVGQQATKTITITNTGNLPAVITATSSLAIPFETSAPVAADLPVNPGPLYVVNVPVTFAPTSPGVVDSTYQVTWTDATGTHVLKVPLTGTGVEPTGGIAVPPPGGGWTFNGSARMAGAALSLTQLVQNQAGSAVYSNPEPSNGLNVSFTESIGNGTGADGMTLSLLDASKVKATALGGSGAELGYGGLPGVAITLDTSQDGTGYPSSNFLGIATSASGGLLTFQATATNIPALRTGTHVVGVTVSGGKVTVTIDGKQYLSVAVTVPKLVLVGFTAGTGTGTDDHIVTGVKITANGHPIPPPGGGWTYNGSAGVSGSDTVLTSTVQNQAGSVVYSTPVQASGLRVSFDAQFGGGTGGEGLTFAMLNPAKTSATTVGGAGTLLGLGTGSGLPGIGVVLGTYEVVLSNGPSTNFAAITSGVLNAALTFQRVAQGITLLESGTHTVTVTVTHSASLGYVLTVWLDGIQIMQEFEPTMTPTVRLAFTAGTGTVTDLHIVREVSIAASK